MHACLIPARHLPSVRAGRTSLTPTGPRSGARLKLSPVVANPNRCAACVACSHARVISLARLGAIRYYHTTPAVLFYLVLGMEAIPPRLTSDRCLQNGELQLGS